MSFRLVPKSVTLNDLERRNGHYIVISLNLVNLCCRKRSVAEFMQETIVFLLRVQWCRKESSRSLSHLLMSFLYANTFLSLSLLVISRDCNPGSRDPGPFFNPEIQGL